MFDFLLYVILFWLGLKLAILLLNFFLFPVLKPQKRGEYPAVSLLIPARNEAHNLLKTLPGFLKQDVQEILILDDSSTDETSSIVQQFAQQDRRVRLLEGLPKPEGWMGKTWACQQLSERASGDILLFSDADVFWAEGGVEAVLARMSREKAGFVSVYPRQITPTLPERVLLPLIDDVLLSYLPYPLVWTPFPSASAANGQVMAFTRAAYAACGGHAAVQGEVLEDVKLAQKVKAAGERISLALGNEFILVKMYGNYAEIIEGFAKNLIEFHARSRMLLALSFLGHLLAYTLSWLLIFLNPLWGLVGLMGLLERLILNLKTGREWWELVLVPLAPLYAAAIYWRSAQRSYTWKGRVYQR